MNEDTGRFKERIYAALIEAEFLPETAQDIAFHMTDWDHNFRRPHQGIRYEPGIR
jgi:hypothetical protein